MKNVKWMVVIAAFLAIAGCATGPQTSSAPKKTQLTSWDGGIWNSVLGYHGPANSMSMAYGPQ